jgi:hypothetical protein
MAQIYDDVTVNIADLSDDVLLNLYLDMSYDCKFYASEFIASIIPHILPEITLNIIIVNKRGSSSTKFTCDVNVQNDVNYDIHCPNCVTLINIDESHYMATVDTNLLFEIESTTWFEKQVSFITSNIKKTNITPNENVIINSKSSDDICVADSSCDEQVSNMITSPKHSEKLTNKSQNNKTNNSDRVDNITSNTKVCNLGKKDVNSVFYIFNGVFFVHNLNIKIVIPTSVHCSFNIEDIDNLNDKVSLYVFVCFSKFVH